jgi:shikimate 5-dehydrogenase
MIIRTKKYIKDLKPFTYTVDAKNNAEILIFGAGGSSIATVLHLMNKKNKDDRPPVKNHSS